MNGPNVTLTVKEKQELDGLVCEEFIGVLADKDILIDCFEMIYERFLVQDIPLTDARDKLLLTYLNLRWEYWRKLLTDTLIEAAKKMQGDK